MDRNHIPNKDKKDVTGYVIGYKESSPNHTTLISENIISY